MDVFYNCLNVSIKSMALSTELLKILVCPVTKDRLIYDQKRQILVSVKAGLAYPIIDDIPIMLEDKARKLDPKLLKEILAEQDKTLDTKIA